VLELFEFEEETKALKVKDVMTKESFLVDASQTIREVAIAMDRTDHGCLLVTMNGEIAGIVTERDLVRRALTKCRRLSKLRVKSIMSSPLIVIKPDACVEDAAKVMSDNRIRRLPVVGEDGLAGVISVTDIARSLAEQQQFHDTLLNAMVSALDTQNAVYA